MNDNQIEQKLRALTDTLQRPDPTPEWKAGILSRALLEASPVPIRKTLPPRWLVGGWAAAWIAILAMNSSIPEGNKPSLAELYAPRDTDLTDIKESILIAFQQRHNFNLE